MGRASSIALVLVLVLVIVIVNVHFLVIANIHEHIDVLTILSTVDMTVKTAMVRMIKEKVVIKKVVIKVVIKVVVKASKPTITTPTPGTKVCGFRCLAMETVGQSGM